MRSEQEIRNKSTSHPESTASESEHRTKCQPSKPDPASQEQEEKTKEHSTSEATGVVTISPCCSRCCSPILSTDSQRLSTASEGCV